MKNFLHKLPPRYAKFFAQLLLILVLLSTPLLLFFLYFHFLSPHTPHSDSSSPDVSALLSGAPSPTPAFEQFSLDVFRNEVTCDTISLHYTLANPKEYGITDIPVTLGSFHKQTDKNEVSGETAADLYERLISYPYDSLTKEEQLTYDTLNRLLALLMKDNASPYLDELLGPTTGFQAQLPILLAEYRFYSKEDVETYLNLLPCCYDYFKELASFENEKSAAGFFMNDETAQEIINQCLAFTKNPDENFLIATFEEKLEPLELSSSEKTKYMLENRKMLFTYVIPAYELLAETLADCLGTGTNKYGLYYFDGGQEYYERSVRLTTGSDRSIEEWKELLSSAVKEHTLAIATAMTDDSSVYESYISLCYPETKPENIMEYLTRACEKDFPLIDCKNCDIKYIPDSLQDYVSPAMYLIPPIDAYEENTIYINPSPVYDMDSLFPTVAHEGYPGHLYQNVAALSGDISPLRYLLGPAGYDEGWATYAEIYCYHYAGFSEALVSFLRSNQAATLCLYSLADIYIHYDGFTPDELAACLENYGFTRAMSDLIYKTMLAEPGAYLPYACGYLEFEALRDEAQKLWDSRYSDYRFHEFLMALGPLPFSVLSRELALTAAK